MSAGPEALALSLVLFRLRASISFIVDIQILSLRHVNGL